MAQEVVFEPIPGIQIENAYLMVGDIWLHTRDQTAEIFVYVFRDESSRRSGIDGIITRQPIRVFVHYPQYQEFFSAAALSEHGSNPIRAAYALLATYDEPLGMRELFQTGASV